MKKKWAVGLIVAVVVIALIGVGVAYAQEQERQRQANEAHDAQVYSAYEDYGNQLDSLSDDNSTAKADLLSQITKLNDLKAAVEVDAQKFILHDGEPYKYDGLVEGIEHATDKAKSAVIALDNAELTANSIDPNAEGVTKEALAGHIAVLQSLVSTVSTEGVWKIADQETFTAKANELIAAYTTKVEEITKAEEEAAAEAEAERVAREQAMATAVQQPNNNSGYSPDYSGGNSGGGNNDGSFGGQTLYWNTLIGEGNYYNKDGDIIFGPNAGESIWGQ